MRLINADLLIKQGYCLCRHSKQDNVTHFAGLNEIPTAYNVEKVIERLDNVLRDEISQAVADEVIEIVKGAGVDE